MKKNLLNILKRETLFGKSHKNILEQYLYLSGLLGYFNSINDDVEGIKKATKKIDKYLLDVKDNRSNKKKLKALKTILGNYVINSDNFIKMALIYYRINANIPVIIMGETGCGKTSLIKKLNEIQNNGEKKVEIIKIHSGITEQDIAKEMKIINDKAKKQDYIDKSKKGRKKECMI